IFFVFFFFQAEDGIRDRNVNGVQTCALPIYLEYVAYTLGKSRWNVFWTISFPLAWPGLLSGVVLAFARALGEFGATLMIAGYIPNVTDTIPIAIYFAV